MRILVLVGVVTVLTGAGLHVWWNTDAFGRDDFCDGALSSAEVGAVLDGTGRLTQASDGLTPDATAPSCEVRRTSRLLGAEQPRLTVGLSNERADFAFQTVVWKNPSGMSYLVGGATGAVSDTRGWVMLPAACRSKLGVDFGKTGTVPVIEVNVTDGDSTRQAVARVAVDAARHVTEKAGCPDKALRSPVRLRGPVDSGHVRRSDTNKVCGIKGFRLPERAFIRGKAAPGTELYTGSGTRTWACDVYLQGRSTPQLTFSFSQDPVLAEAARFNGSKGTLGTHTMVKCGPEEAYVGVEHNSAYQDLWLDNSPADDDLDRVLRSFATAVAKDRGCTTAP
ncbi:hypothetical protein LRS74_19435 [Streptomyces sp. LX-29]|uniref:hypothetical protein n=1 Tax=Streptomyces sp. LX-29 TaxID=2900152 RepID=UPI00240E3DF1|nr:hypothetical protein [Streptomyces sp. LX-29]WFB08972.1 hypothetical protein LRS74_19435 [Streptomyces sp. LX-29]